MSFAHSDNSGNESEKYDVLLIHSDSKEDTDFASHLIDRMEMTGLRVKKDPPKTEHLVLDSVLKVVLICSPSFFSSPECMFLMRVATHVDVVQSKKRILPVMLKSCPNMSRDCPEIDMLTKLPFNPRLKTVNFYRRLLVDALGVSTNLPQEVFTYPSEYTTTQSEEGSCTSDDNNNNLVTGPTFSRTFSRSDSVSSLMSCTEEDQAMKENYFRRNSGHLIVAARSLVQRCQIRMQRCF